MDLNTRRQRLGWLLYDWANSAYVTTVAVAVLPAFFASAVVPATGIEIFGKTWAATTLWSLAMGVSALLIFVIGPALGAAADFSGRKKIFLAFFCYMGALSTLLLWFSGADKVFLTLGLFIVAQVGFSSANVFYDAFLPQVAGDRRLDRVSGQGFAWGYVGGGLQFGLSLILISLHAKLGMSQSQAARLAMVFAALWWAGFASLTMLWLRDPAPGARLTPKALMQYSRRGFTQVFRTLRRIRQHHKLMVFLLAFLFYNDGIQTIIYMATIYGKAELGFSTTTLMLTLLMIQVVACPGALLFGRMAGKIGARRALMASLVLWSVVAVYAYFLIYPWEYFLLGAGVGLILGGSQALSRSLFASMIPREFPAEYFGFFSIFNKFSSIAGPFVFALIREEMGSARPAVLSLTIFFAVGLALLHVLGNLETDNN